LGGDIKVPSGSQTQPYWLETARIHRYAMDPQIEPTTLANDAKLQVISLNFAAGSIPGAS
jgi:hypothetical protein